MNRGEQYLLVGKKREEKPQKFDSGMYQQKNKHKNRENESKAAITLMMKLVRRPSAVSAWSSEKLPAGSVDPDRVTATSAAQQRWDRSGMAMSSKAKAPRGAIFALDTCEMVFCWSDGRGVAVRTEETGECSKRWRAVMLR